MDLERTKQPRDPPPSGRERGRPRPIKAGDYVASDDNEATLTVVAVEGDRALCRWFVDGDVDGDEQEAWIDLRALTVL